MLEYTIFCISERMCGSFCFGCLSQPMSSSYNSYISVRFLPHLKLAGMNAGKKKVNRYRLNEKIEV